MATKKKAPAPAVDYTKPLTGIFEDFRTGVTSDTDALARRLTEEENRSRGFLGDLGGKINASPDTLSNILAIPAGQASTFRSALTSRAGSDITASRGREQGARAGLTSMLAYLEKAGQLQQQAGSLRARQAAAGRGGGSQGFSPWQQYRMFRDQFVDQRKDEERAARAAEEEAGYVGEIVPELFEEFGFGQRIGPEKGGLYGVKTRDEIFDYVRGTYGDAIADALAREVNFKFPKK